MKNVLGTLILFLLMPLRLGAAAAAHTVLVFPFENQSKRPDLNWISEGLADILSSRLDTASCYVLGRPEREGAYAQLGFPSGAPLTLASEYKVAETLGVDWAVVGGFKVEGDRMIARAQLLDVSGLKLAPPLEAIGELADLADLSSQLGWRILVTRDSQFTFKGEEDFRRRFPEIRLDGFENYIRGVLATDDQDRVRFWREADRLNPLDLRAAFALGRFYFEQKEYAKSAEWLRKIDANDKNYRESVFLLGVDDFFLGHAATAEKAFYMLARDIPLNEVSNNLAVLEARRGLYAEALPSFERAYEGDSTDPDFAFNLAACLWYLKKYGETAKVLEELARENGDDAETHSFRAAVFAKVGDAAGERRELDWLVRHDAGSPGENLARNFFPEMRLKKNYNGRAFQVLSVTVSHVLEEALAREPVARHGAVHLEQGKRLLGEGRLSEAQDQLTEAVALLPRDSEARLTLAQVYEAQSRHREAISELEASLELKPTPAAHLLLARIDLGLGQDEDARKHIQAVLAVEPGNSEASWLSDQVSQRASASRKTP